MPKCQNDTLDISLEMKIIAILNENPSITQDTLAKELGVSLRSLKRIMGKLVENGKIERKGGKRYGYWDIYG